MSFKTIFLTGGTGFLGNEPMRAFRDERYEIRALVRSELGKDRSGVAELGYTYRSLERGLCETLASMNIQIADYEVRIGD